MKEYYSSLPWCCYSTDLYITGIEINQDISLHDYSHLNFNKITKTMRSFGTFISYLHDLENSISVSLSNPARSESLNQAKAPKVQFCPVGNYCSFFLWSCQLSKFLPKLLSFSLFIINFFLNLYFFINSVYFLHYVSWFHLFPGSFTSILQPLIKQNSRDNNTFLNNAPPKFLDNIKIISDRLRKLTFPLLDRGF